MKNITRRTFISFVLAGILILGTGFFVYRFFALGSDWASYTANDHLYTNGNLNSGSVLDRNGVMLAVSNDGEWSYNEDSAIRKSLLHTVGTPGGQIATGAITKFASYLAGYNFLTGTQHLSNNGRNIYLTVDANLCKTAYTALGNYNGVVGVYNYETGEILCMVSTPSFDPANPPKIDDDDPEYEGVYLNSFISSSFTPGSTFKLVTLLAAIETIPDIETRTFHCDGSVDIDGKTITCSGVHGDISLEKAINVSCNCAFGQIAVELGGKVLEDYANSTGLTTSYSINHISTKKSSFDFEPENDGNLAWAGVGQYKDLLNPCSMMIYMGAIANEGKAAVPQIISQRTLKGGLKTSFYIEEKTERLISSSSAQKMSEYMKSNIVNHYGEKKFPGLDIYAKTGTAQVDTSKASNSWFVGFIKNENAPYAFVVYAEGGGSGASTAANIANTVLQAAVSSASNE